MFRAVTFHCSRAYSPRDNRLVIMKLFIPTVKNIGTLVEGQRGYTLMGDRHTPLAILDHVPIKNLTY